MKNRETITYARQKWKKPIERALLVRSKSGVIMASILTNLGVGYEYEKPLHSKKDEKDFRLPGFTTKYKEEEYYWGIFACLKVPSTKESPRALSIFEGL